jgi:hypothetical protein
MSQYKGFLLETLTSYYREIKIHVPSRFYELENRTRLKFEVQFLTLQKRLKHHIPRRTSGLDKRAVNFTDIEMYLRCKSCRHF